MPLLHNRSSDPERNGEFREAAVARLLADPDAISDLLFVGPRVFQEFGFSVSGVEDLREWAKTEGGARRLDTLFEVIVALDDRWSGRLFEQINGVRVEWEKESAPAGMSPAEVAEHSLLRAKVASLSLVLRDVDRDVGAAGYVPPAEPSWLASLTGEQRPDPEALRELRELHDAREEAGDGPTLAQELALLRVSQGRSRP